MAWNWGWFGSLFGRGSDGPDLLFAGLFRGGRANGRGGDDIIIGGFGNDRLNGGSGDDRLFGNFGNDALHGGKGDDRLYGGRGNDILEGGSGDDHLKGGRGYDKFVFDPSNDKEGHDTIKDLELGKDRIVLNAADVFRAGPNALRASGEETALEVTDFDPSADWQLEASPHGNVVVVHPGGKIEIEGLPFSPDLTFADLLGAIEIQGLVSGNDHPNHLRGSRDDDLVQGLDGNDRLRGRGGDDVLLGGEGNDKLFGGRGDDDLIGGGGDDWLTGGRGGDNFRFDPSNPSEGADVIKDFGNGADRVLLNAADVARSDPQLFSASGDADALDLTDFDAAPDDRWNVEDAGDGDIRVRHINGTIELNGVAFGVVAGSFADLVTLGALGLEGFLDGDGDGNALFGSNIDDLIQGRDGADILEGGIGHDVLLGGAGMDSLSGGSDDDHLTGGADADTYLFDPSNPFEGNDVIKDFEVGLDLILLNAADVVRADPDLIAASGDPHALDLTDFDAADPSLWDVVPSADDDVLVIHPGGQITLEGVGFGAGTDSFADLVAAGALGLSNLVPGDDTDNDLSGGSDDDLIQGLLGDDTLAGNDGNDVIFGGGGQDTIVGGSGDDLLKGGADDDRFLFDPSNPNEGVDVIQDFTLLSDVIGLSLSDILDADPDVIEASGDPTALEFGDLDADSDWDLFSNGGDLAVKHPGGVINLQGVAFDPSLTFEGLGGLGAVDVS